MSQKVLIPFQGVLLSCRSRSCQSPGRSPCLLSPWRRIRLCFGSCFALRASSGWVAVVAQVVVAAQLLRSVRCVWVTLSAADLLRSPKICSWQREQTTLDFWQASFTLDASENDVSVQNAGWRRAVDF